MLLLLLWGSSTCRSRGVAPLPAGPSRPPPLPWRDRLRWSFTAATERRCMRCTPTKKAATRASQAEMPR